MSTDLALPDESAIEAAANPREAGLVALTHAKALLVELLEREEPLDALEHLGDLRAQAEAFTVLSARKQLGKDIELDAVEIQRRCEFHIAKRIREGQERGEINRRGGDQSKVVQHDFAPVPVSSVASRGVLVGGGSSPGAYAMADGISEESFDEAIEEAKAEGNLSRANVVRKIQGEPKPKGDRHELLRKTRRLDSNRIVRATVDSVRNIDSMFEHIDYDALDRDELLPWISSLSDSIRSLTTLKSNLKKELIRGEH